MTEELELFSEDASEQLQFMENALLDATENGVDDDKIGEIFRAMHTIKGTAGMFGFDTVVEFTHIAENLLDEVRKHTVETSEEMLALFLECKDHTEHLIELAIEEENLDDETKDRDTELLNSLITYMPGTNVNTAPTSISDSAIDNAMKIMSSKDTTWHVSIRFDEDFFTSGMDIISIFNFFNKMGEIIINIPVIENVPLLEDTDPLKTKIGFELDFQTDVGYDDIEEIFEFVIDDVELAIFQHDDLNALSKLISKQKNHNLRNLLIEEGIYTLEEIETQSLAISETVEDDVIDEIVIEEPQQTIVQETPSEIGVVTKEEPKVGKSEKKEKVEKKPKSEKKEVKKNSSLRVDSSKIDQLINQISEMVIANAKIIQISDDREDTQLEEAAASLSDMLEEVRNGIMNIRMVQVEDSFVKFKRIVKDTAKKIGKEIDFHILGGETELDKTVVEKISDPLVHMLRNSVDHGVEMPDEREAKGKSRKGTVNLRTYTDSGSVVIEIEDDGAGINKDRLLGKAIENGIVPENHNLTEKEIFMLIFAAGLSTAQAVSDISGRGVGMDVVRRNIEDLRGTIDIESTTDKGSLITIRLPLTLAIIDGFLVQAGETKYIIPLENIQECIELTDEYKDKMKGNDYINLRGEILPILDIRKYFKEESSSEELRENVVIVKYTNDVIGLQVDELFGEHQTVVKPLGDIFQNVHGISGGSILGSGEVSIIFDIPKLIEYKINEINRKG